MMNKIIIFGAYVSLGIAHRALLYGRAYGEQMCSASTNECLLVSHTMWCIVLGWCQSSLLCPEN